MINKLEINIKRKKKSNPLKIEQAIKKKQRN